MKRHKHLWERLCSFENLAAAAREALLGKRGQHAGARFFADWEREVVRGGRAAGVRRFARRYRWMIHEAKCGRMPLAAVTQSVKVAGYSSKARVRIQGVARAPVRQTHGMLSRAAAFQPRKARRICHGW